MPIYATATRCFIEVARLGSIRAASEQLALTPSAVHRQIKWLEIELETGRTHQIRLQAASRGHPVVGDLRYQSTVTLDEQSVNERTRSIALHARRISFFHPMTREPRTAVAPLPLLWKSADLLPVGHPWLADCKQSQSAT